MKKLFVILVFIFLFISVCFGQSITINSIGMHKDGEPGNFEVSPGDVVKVSVNYSSEEIFTIQNVNFNGTLGKIMLYGFANSTPDAAPIFGSSFDISNFLSEGPGDNKTATFIFTYSGSQIIRSYQLTFGLSGLSSIDYFTLVNGNSYSSYRTVGPFTFTGSLAEGDFQSFLEILIVEEPPLDEETLAPTLFTPNSPTEATYDNETLRVKFQLAEQANSHSVKLYFYRSPNGENWHSTLTLASNYESSARAHSIDLNANDFSEIPSNILYRIQGENSLTHMETYYVALGYEDALGNEEAFSSLNKLIYDNEFEFSEPCWADPFYSQNLNEITLTFFLDESSVGDAFLEIFDVNHGLSKSDRVMTLRGYNFVPGENQLTIRGDSLNKSLNFLSLSPTQYSLTSGYEYQYELKLTDLSGNIGVTTPSSVEIYYFNPEIEVKAGFSEYQEDLTFDSSISNSHQKLGTFKIQTDPEQSETPLTSKLNSITFTVNPGSSTSANISEIKLSDALQNTYGSVISYAGPGEYTVSNIDKTINSSLTTLYFTYKIDYTGSSISDDEYISMSIAQDGIVTEGNIVSYSTTTAKKFLKQCLIVAHKNLQPEIMNNDRETPFFRLDLRTNDGTLNLLALNNFRVWGTIEGNDIADGKIRLYESSSPTFDLTTRVEPLKTVIFDDQVSFGNLNLNITPATKYYYFTIRISDDFDPTHTILGNFEDEANIFINPMLSNIMGFPLNNHSDLSEYMTLPVELSSFTATFHLTDGVGLSWVTESETNISGYHIYRNETDSFESSLRINPLLISNGIENGTQKIYSYLDDEVELKTDYYYWLQSLEYDGLSDYYGPFSVYTDEEHIEDELQVNRPVTELLSAYPNPFNPDVSIPYKLIESNSVEISIFNIKGQKVRTLVHNNQEPGDYSVYFDGRDEEGNRLSSGIYFYRMKTDTYSQTNKMILLK